MKESTKLAIEAKISAVTNALRARASRIVAESMIAQAKREGGGVTMALIEIKGEPLKEAEAELIAYYVEVGVARSRGHVGPRRFVQVR